MNEDDRETTPAEGASAREADAPAAPATNGGGGRRPRRGRIWRRLVLLAILLSAAAGGAFLWLLGPPDAGAGNPVVFDVRPGWGAARVARELEEAGLIRDAAAFSIYLRLAGLDRSVGEGLYDLGPHLSALEVAERLSRGGRPRVATVVIPEGFRVADVADRLEARGVAPEEEVLERATEPGELRPPWLPEEAGLEGYLFPDTYELRLDADADEVLSVMVEHFATRLDEEVLGRLADADLGVHEWTTLASMVQAEAAGPEEMKVIAGVFLNRLDRGMLLQSDPTVAYGLGKDLPQLSAVEGDLARDHPWNTYTRPGLPAGPIGNPGMDALRAVLEPERLAPDGEPWLYFLHGTDDGVPVFRPNRTLQAHERDIERYLR